MVFLIAAKRYSNRSNQRSSFHVPSFKNNYVKTFALSLVMAFFMVFTLYGLYGMLAVRDIPIPYAVALLIFAVLFVIGYEFFDSRLANKKSALAVGFVFSLFLTIVLIALINFGLMAYHGDVTGIGWEKFIIAFAVCLIISVLLLKYAENY
ncbi:hypothetical protein MsAg5_04840 [Methanosarcinaceae archaeon Ag5]|uniref:Heat-shock protein n=1 Tax=Methanolapillus africanus TaxID=3028297 RepID=A0AAE4SET2_9EURY|nr:hypothetical protein [Methanosarcinaceae archaeon Ag5]